MVLLTEIPEQSSSSSLPTFDVFLSFRGTDTRSNFTDHLLKALEDASIHTFFDDTDIQIGEFLKPELESAITSSRASVIVLSKYYASSTHCLDELALIMEQRRTTKHTVFPIFYHVKPSDVRKQRKCFGDAMAEHKQRMEAETNEEKRSEWAEKIKQWEKALREVSDLKGEEANGRRETILIEGIVKEIGSILHLDKRSRIPHIIGMGSSIRRITSFLKDRSQQSNEIFTIWGMAGIGKTHIADYIFKSHHLEFESSCFLEDIERRCTTTNGLLDLQKQLLKDIRARNWMDINNVDVGTLKIEKSLLRKRTLLVLDGINKFEHLDALIGTKGLHPGSKIIITSKNGSLTEKCRLFETQDPPKHTKHLLQGLNHEESLQLLSWHAFRRNQPNEGDEKEYSMKVVQYCKGHPLALKVLGSSVHSEDATLEDILESLGKEIDPDIEKVLKVSLDTLPSEKDKELFKHIACLFVGEDIKFTQDILKACGVCKPSGIKILINRCFLTAGYHDELKMHQLFQELGRDIVRQESPKKPCERSILWHHEECLDVLQNRQGTTIIQALTLDMRTFEDETPNTYNGVDMQKSGFRSFLLFIWIHILLSVIWWLLGQGSGMGSSSRKTKGDFETLSFAEMRNLKILQLNYVQLSGSYKKFPQGLRWLRMHGFPLSYIPSDLQMENMVALDMSNSKLRQLWEKPKLLKSLKFLNLSNCYELVRVGHFSSLPLLERLTLTRCISLVEVCESIGTYCPNLEVLDLSECSQLKELPRSIAMLKNLTRLLIDGFSNLGEFLVELKYVESLNVLKAQNINMKSLGTSSSTMVPRSFKFFVSSLPRSLVTLSLQHCNLYNENFPMDFSSLSMLKELYLDGNPIVSMPDCVRSLSRLEALSFRDCDSLKTVLCAPILLNFMLIMDCNSLDKVTFHPETSALPYLVYDCHFTMTEIHDMFKIQALSEIDEKVLRSLGWINIEYLNRCRYLKADCLAVYSLPEVILPVPAQMLYEHGIFSTYLQGQEVPKWFTHRSNESTFTLQSSPQKGKIQGMNVCIVRTISSMMEVGPWRIEIRNLTKNASWTYQPIMYVIPEDDEFKNGDEVIVVWFSHWMFKKNEFEDGDEVRIHLTVKDCDLVSSRYCYSRGPYHANANVKEYGISFVYDDDGGGGGGRGKQKEDPMGYYQSWKRIIGGDLSDYEASPSHYILTPSNDHNAYRMLDSNFDNKDFSRITDLILSL